MKKMISILSLALLTACTSQKTQENTNTAAVETPETETVETVEAVEAEPEADEYGMTPIADCDMEAVAYEREFLALFHTPGSEDLTTDTGWLNAHCSDNVLQMLRDAFDYEGEGYAHWLLCGNVADSEALNASAEVVGVAYGMRNGKPTHALTKVYDDGETRQLCTFFYVVEVRNEENYVITSFDYTDMQNVER